jgi:amino acid efflux transporter
MTSPRTGVTVVQGTALYVGAVLGTGVIALPAMAAKTAGPASLLAWLALVIASIPLAAAFAALGARFPDSGGVSTYARRAFGERVAGVVGWCFYWAVPVGAPAAALFGGAYVSDALGGGRATELVTAFALIGVVSGTNYFGVRVSGRAQVVLSGLLVALLLVTVVSSAPHAHLRHLHPFAPHGWLAIGPAAALLVWSFAGWEAVTYLAADFRRPHRDLPRATTAAVALVAVFYLAIAAVTVLVLGASAGGDQAPLGSLMAIGIGGSARTLAAVAAVLLTLGTMNAYYAGAAKLGAALGRDGALPGWLARGSSAGEVPRRSLLVVSGLSLVAQGVVAALGADPHPLVLATTGCFVLVYLIGMAAALRLLPRGSWGRRAAGAAIPLVAVLAAASGWYLLWPAVLTGGALLYLRGRAAVGTPEPVAEPALDTVVSSASDGTTRRDGAPAPVPALASPHGEDAVEPVG